MRVVAGIGGPVVEAAGVEPVAARMEGRTR